MLTRIFRGRDWSSPGFRTIRPVLRPLLFRGWTRDAPNPKTRVYPCRRRDRPDRARLALGCLSSRFVLPCLKRSTTPPPRRGTRRGGPLPTAPAHDARSRARTPRRRSGRPRARAPTPARLPPPPATRGLDGSSSRPPLAAPFRLVREKNRRDASPPLPPPLLDMRASPSRLALALALALALTASPRARSPCRRREGCITPTAARWGRSTGAVFLETRDPRALSTLLRPS